MRYARWMVVTAVLFATHGTASAAREERIELKWSELGQAVAGRTVQMVLPDGTSLKGPVLNVTSEALEIQIKKTSNRKAYPKGQFSVPRSSVSVLQMREVKGSWRAIGTALGAGAGSTLAWFVAQGVFHFTGEGSATPGRTGIVAGLGAGVTAAGYFLGREADKRATIITIVREEASAEFDKTKSESECFAIAIH